MLKRFYNIGLAAIVASICCNALANDFPDPVSDEVAAEVMASYQDSYSHYRYFNANGMKVSLRDLFRGELSDLSRSELRWLGVKSFSIAENGPERYAISALLLDHADHLLAQTWINEKDAARRIQLRKESRTEFDSTHEFKAFAAFNAANHYSHEEMDSNFPGPAFIFHSIAAEAGVQRSKLALGYLLRHYRLENPDATVRIWELTYEEKRHFEQASNCTSNANENGIFGYETELCELARQEWITAEDAQNRYLYSGNEAMAGVIMGFVGLVGLGMIINEQFGGVDTSSQTTVQPFRGPTELEAHLWLNP